MATMTIELDDCKHLLVPKDWLRQASSVLKMYGKCPSCNDKVRTRCTCPKTPQDKDWQYLDLSPEQFILYLRISAAPISAEELTQGLAMAEYLGDDATLAKYG